MLTTAGSNFSARLAKLSGAERALTVNDQSIMTNDMNTSLGQINFEIKLDFEIDLPKAGIHVVSHNTLVVYC